MTGLTAAGHPETIQVCFDSEDALDGSGLRCAAIQCVHCVTSFSFCDIRLLHVACRRAFLSSAGSIGALLVPDPDPEDEPWIGDRFSSLTGEGRCTAKLSVVRIPDVRS
jgi:hypothetical protein